MFFLALPQYFCIMPTPTKRQRDARLKRQQRELQRLEVLRLYRVLDNYYAVGREMGMNEATVRSIVKRYQEKNVKDKPRSGRPKKITSRYDCLQLTSSIHSSVVRWRRRLLQLNWKRPFWSAQRLIDAIHGEMMKGISNVAGARVCDIFKHPHKF